MTADSLVPGAPQRRGCFPSPRYALALVGVLAAALGVRLYVLAHTENIARDGVLYLHMGRQFTQRSAAEVIQQTDYHPGYAATVMALSQWAGAPWPDGWVRVGQWVSILMSLAALAALYYVACAAFDPAIALVTVLLIGLSGAYIRTSCDVISDSMCLAMVLLSVAFALAALRRVRGRSWWAPVLAGASGLSAGAGYLTRPEGILGAGAALVLLLLPRRLGARGRAIQAATVAALAATVLVCVLPYAHAIGGFTQKKTLADFVLSAGDGPMLAAASGPTDAWEAFRRGLDRLRAGVGTPITVLVLITAGTWLARTVPRLGVPRSVVAIPSRQGAVAMFLPAILMIPLVMLLEYKQPGRYISSRHMLIPAFLLTPLAGAAVVTLAQWTLCLADTLRLRRIPRLAIGGWVAALVIVMSFDALPILHKGKGCYRQAGLAIRRRFGSGALVLTDDSRVALFAAAPGEQFLRSTVMPSALHPGDAPSFETFLRQVNRTCRAGGYAVIAVSGRFLARVGDRDLLSRLPDEEFEPIATFQSGRKDKVWLLRRR